MKFYHLLIGIFIHLASCATFAGQSDHYADFMARPETGRGPIFGHAVRKLASDKPGQVIADTGLGEGKFWRQDPSTGKVEDVTHMISALNSSEQEALKAHQELWAKEEAGIQFPALSEKQEAVVKQTLKKWNAPKSARVKREDRTTVIKVGDVEITEEHYHALKAEAEAEFGEFDEKSMMARDGDSAQIFPMFFVLAAVFWPAVVTVGAAILASGAIAGGVAGGISAHKKHRKKEKKKKKEKEDEERRNGGKGRKTKTKRDGVDVWETKTMGDVEVTSFTELAAGPTAVAV